MKDEAEGRLIVRAAITADGKLDDAEREPEELRRLFEQGRVGEIHLTVRPRIDGRGDAATLGGTGREFFPASVRCRLLAMEVRGDECVLRYRVLRTRAKRVTGATA